MLDGDHSDAEDLGHRDGELHSLVCGYEAEPVMRVHLRDSGCHLPDCWDGAWVKCVLSDPFHVGGDAVAAMCVYAAEIG